MQEQSVVVRTVTRNDIAARDYGNDTAVSDNPYEPAVALTGEGGPVDQGGEMLAMAVGDHSQHDSTSGTEKRGCVVVADFTVLCSVVTTLSACLGRG
jgi:hypothetical protein